MAINSTQRQEINRRRRLVSKLRHEGVKRQRDIAERLKVDYGIVVDRSTVSLDLKALDKLWQEQAIEDTDAWKQEVIAQHRYLYQQAMAAWELSLEDKEAETVESVAGGADGTGRDKIQQKTEGQSGNPAHLANADKALKAIRDIIGLDAPSKQQLFNFNLSQATDEQLLRIANGEHPATVMADSGRS